MLGNEKAWSNRKEATDNRLCLSDDGGIRIWATKPMTVGWAQAGQLQPVSGEW